jgi:parallel beta-helix repeat protein
MKNSVILIITLCFWSVTTAANTYYIATVDNNGHDANSGSISAPWATLSRAVKAMKPGDTVYLRGGTYQWSTIVWDTDYGFPSGTDEAHRITIARYPGEKPIWKIQPDPSGGPSLAVRMWRANYVTFDGLTIDGTNGSNGLGGYTSANYTSVPVPGAHNIFELRDWISGNWPGPHHITIKNCELSHTAYDAINIANTSHHVLFQNNYVHHIGKVSVANVVYLSGHDNIIEGNTFQDVASSIGIWAHDPSGTANDNIVRYNMIIRAGYYWAPTLENGDNKWGSPSFHWDGIRNRQGSVSFHQGIWIGSGSRNLIYNNVIIDSPGGILVGHSANDSGNQVYNNTIYGNTAQIPSAYSPSEYNSGIAVVNGSGAIVRNNIVWMPGSSMQGLYISPTATGTIADHNLFVDPQFVNSSAHDFRLRAGSPAIDKGVSLSPVATDFDGLARPQGVAFDIGAYEYLEGTADTTAPIVMITSPVTGSIVKRRVQ